MAYSSPELKPAVPQPDPVKQYIMETFGQDINHTTGFDPMANEYSSLFNSIYRLSLDQGLLRRAKITNSQLVKQFPETQDEAEAVLMLSRTAAIYKAEQLGADQFQYHFLDIAQMRQADLAGAGDWLLNRVAQALKTVCGNKLCCRYGGDEFMIMTPINEDSTELLNKAKEAIKAIMAFYQSTDESNVIEQRPVTLKHDEIITIKPPTEPIDLTIFNTFVSRGIILSPEQVEKIKSKPEFQTNHGLDLNKLNEFLASRYWQNRNLYPPTLLESVQSKDQNVLTRMDYLGTYYPEFKVALELCQALDGSGPLTRTEAAVNFIEKVIFDRLLGDVFYSYQHLAENLQAQQYSELFSIDAKFLKEINDRYSYVDGDEMLIAAWKQIRQVLGPERQHFTIARRAGTFILALKKGYSLDSELRKKLISLNLFTMTLEGERVVLPLGVAHHIVDYTNSDKPEWLRQQLGVIEDSGDQWYRNANIETQSDPSTIFTKLLELHFAHPDRGLTRLAQKERALQT